MIVQSRPCQASTPIIYLQLQGEVLDLHRWDHPWYLWIGALVLLMNKFNHLMKYFTWHGKMMVPQTFFGLCKRRDLSCGILDLETV